MSSLPGALEARGLELVGHTDLSGKGDGMQIMRNGDFLYVGHMGDFGVGTSVVDVSDPRHPRVVRQISVPKGTHSHKVQLANGLLVVNYEQYPYRIGVPERTGLGVYDVTREPGDPQLLYNDLYDFPQVKPILVRHETSAVFMAMAYARISGRVGVVHASPGPGTANLVPGLLEAVYACSPLVCVVSAASRLHEGRGGFQDSPSLEMLRPVTKWATRIDLAERTAWTMQRAFALARNGRPGPIVVEIPSDVAGTAAEIPEYRVPLAIERHLPEPKRPSTYV